MWRNYYVYQVTPYELQGSGVKAQCLWALQRFGSVVSFRKISYVLESNWSQKVSKLESNWSRKGAKNWGVT